MSLFPRFVASEFAPMFRLMDDYANHVATRGPGALGDSFSSSLRSFQPRFDVKENKDAYELHGELPGIRQEDINIDFTDANTLSIKGRTEHIREEGERPAGFIEGQAEQGRITEGETGYHKPSVEDDSTMSGANSAANPNETPKEDGQTEVTSRPKDDGPKYWVSERSIGEFSRSFSFPQRVDQDAVKASLKNGILSIVVPKAAAPVSRRINIE